MWQRPKTLLKQRTNIKNVLRQIVGIHLYLPYIIYDLAMVLALIFNSCYAGTISHKQSGEPPLCHRKGLKYGLHMDTTSIWFSPYHFEIQCWAHTGYVFNGMLFFVLAKETDDSKLLVVRQAYYRCLILGLSVPFLSACGNQLKTFQSYWLRSTLIKQLCTSQSKPHPTLGYVGLVGI